MAEKGRGRNRRLITFFSSSCSTDLDVSFQFIEVVVTFAVMKADIFWNIIIQL